ncbi:MAG: 4Fe-4S binding protein [Dehalococcoidia bacterium]|nr:4Fe-4S binding protein [Dehalococcoidia bacterium]
MSPRSKFEGPWADPADPLFSIRTADWRHQRPVTKVGKCCQCGTCYLFCTTGCVSDRGTYFTADLEYCKGCGLCANLCPVSAIVMVREEI